MLKAPRKRQNFQKAILPAMRINAPKVKKPNIKAVTAPPTAGALKSIGSRMPNPISAARTTGMLIKKLNLIARFDS